MTIQPFTGIDTRAFRDAMGCFATGITVVTAFDREQDPVGITANSFTSLSLDPPLLLVCIANSSETGLKIRSAARFAINVLQSDQQATSDVFASRGADRFASVDWEKGETGPPILKQALGIYECERHAVYDGGDHFILVGRVARAVCDPASKPLLYFRGKYRQLEAG